MDANRLLGHYLMQPEILRSSSCTTHLLQSLFPTLFEREKASISVIKSWLTVICCGFLQYSVIYGIRSIPACFRSHALLGWPWFVVIIRSTGGYVPSPLRAKAQTRLGSAADKRRYCGFSTCPRWKQIHSPTFPAFSSLRRFELALYLNISWRIVCSLPSGLTAKIHILKFMRMRSILLTTVLICRPMTMNQIGTGLRLFRLAAQEIPARLGIYYDSY